jgi:parallel beta-helix repeat protein
LLETDYWIMTRSEAGDRARRYDAFNSYPLAGNMLSWIVSNNGGGEDPDNFIEIEGITLQGSAYNGSEGNIWANVIKGSVIVIGTEASAYGQNLSIGANGSGYPYGQSTSQGKFICPQGCSDFAPLTRFISMPSQTCECGVLDVPNSACRLERSLRASGTCFKITAPSIILDCNGFSITGDISEGYGIFTDQFNTTIKNCEINDFIRGIYFEGADNGTLSNLTVTASGRDSAAIYISSGSNNVLSNIATFGGSGYALFLGSSSNNVISNLTSSVNSCKYAVPNEMISDAGEKPGLSVLKE